MFSFYSSGLFYGQCQRSCPFCHFIYRQFNVGGKLCIVCEDYNFLGVEYGRECYCSNSQKSSGVSAPEGDCSYPCVGAREETCGARNRIEIYTNNNYVASVNAAVERSQYAGCYVDSVLEKVLGSGNVVTGDMTTSKCAAAAKEYQYFGLEGGRQCRFGNKPPASPAPETDCSTRCSGDSSSVCGAGNRFSVYVATNPNSSNPSPLACPASNGGIYKGRSGRIYQVECSIDHYGGDISVVHTSTLDACLETTVHRDQSSIHLEHLLSDW